MFSIHFPVVVSGHILKLLSHFDWIFENGERQRPSFRYPFTSALLVNEVKQNVLLVVICLCWCFRWLTSSTPSLDDMKKSKNKKHWKIAAYHALGAKSPGDLYFFSLKIFIFLCFVACNVLVAFSKRNMANFIFPYSWIKCLNSISRY